MINLTKYKEEVKDYTGDWTKELSRNGSDTISSSSWVEDSGGITIDSDTNTTKKATVWLSGGNNGETYTVENVVITAGGRTLKRFLNIKVIEVSTKVISGQY